MPFAGNVQSVPQGVTGAAGSAALLGQVSVLWRKFVATFAVRNIPDVPPRLTTLMLGSRERFEMVWVNAVACLADMMQFTSFWD
jgi:hypothetical protein